MSNQQKNQQNALPHRETQLFRQLVKQYESKQYKKAVKSADQVLKAFPDHGETLSMKGLALSGLNRKSEAYELCKLGLRKDIKSHLCWHAYGLIYRADYNYLEAIKCYKQALKIDADNAQLIRDLAVLQIQARDLDGYVETRESILRSKPANRANWIALAVAYYLVDDLPQALSVLSSYYSIIGDDWGSDVPWLAGREQSEVALFQARILVQAGRLEDAEKLLTSPGGTLAQASDAQGDPTFHVGPIRDHVGRRELMAQLMKQQGRAKELAEHYRALIDVYPDNLEYHVGLCQAEGLPVADVAALAQELPADVALRLHVVYRELQATHPDSMACRRVPLNFLSGDAFGQAVEPYIRFFICKGIPSLFADLRALYLSPSPTKPKAIESAALGLWQQLQTSQEPLERPFAEIYRLAEAGSGAVVEKFSEPNPTGGDQSGCTQEQKGWLAHFLSLHFTERRQLERALQYSDEATKHLPNNSDILMGRSRVLKHCGDLNGAADAAVAAFRSDPQDRYSNSVATKRLFQAGRVEEAESMAVTFTRDSDAHNNLFDMQATWYEVASGRAYLASGTCGLALKRFTAVLAHYQMFYEDFFDFHNYCMRRLTLRAYLDSLALQTSLYAQAAFVKGAVGAVKTYLNIHVTRESERKRLEEEAAYLAGLSAEERKRRRQKARKAEQRAKKEAEEKANAAKSAAAENGIDTDVGDKSEGAKGRGRSSKKKAAEDPDPLGEQLAAVEDPLAEAAKLVGQLTEHAGEVGDTWVLARRLHLLRGKLLLAIRAVGRLGAVLGEEHPSVRLGKVEVCLAAERSVSPQAPPPNGGSTSPPAKSPPNSTVLDIIQAKTTQFIAPAKSVAQYLDTWEGLARDGSLLHRVCWARASLAADPASVPQAVAKLVEGGVSIATDRVTLCLEAAEFIHQANDPQLKERWRAICQTAYPHATVFV